MSSAFLLSIFVVGLSGLIAQVLLLRELLVSFLGNELTIGVILANWVILEAIGVFISGKFIDRIRNKVSVFLTLQIIFSVAFPLSIYFSRTFKGLLGIPFGEAVGLYAISFTSFLVLLPTSISHGALFSTICKMHSISAEKKGGFSIGKVYTWEIIGTIAGGLAFTYVFLPYLNSFSIAFIVSIINLLTCLFFLKKALYVYKVSIPALIFLIGLLLATAGADKLQRLSINNQWPNQEVLDYRNSLYGNITVTRQNQQYTFFYNGIPVIVSPFPDKQFVEDFAHLPLLFHKSPKDVLVIGSGAGGLIGEISKHSVENIDYAELDPLIIKMLKRFPTGPNRNELDDRRLKVINSDARFYLKNEKKRYDMVMIGLSRPADLSSNRLFTQEFFALVKRRLRPDGILAFWLPGSLAYISRELRDLNSCILNSANNVFDYVRIIPGDYNIYIAGSSNDIIELSSEEIWNKLGYSNIKTSLLNKAYLDYRLKDGWVEWFWQSLEGATRKSNKDFTPYAVFEMLILWNKKFSPGLASVLSILRGLNLKSVSLFIVFFTLVLLYFFSRRKRIQPALGYAIATTGFFGMLSSLVLILGFQIYFGFLYYMIGLLVSIFMCGAAAGSIFMTKRISDRREGLSLFISLEILIAVFSLTMATLIILLSNVANLAFLIFILLFFISGLLIGLEFPLVSSLYLGKNKSVGTAAGALYACDLIGGWFAGMLGGILFLPVLGLFNTCVVMALFKLSSIFILKKFSLTKIAI